jgi:hypothetical protein
MEEREDETNRAIKTPILQLIGHKSKFRFVKILPSKHATPVVEFVSSIYSIIGPPLYLQSDNGKEFVNKKLLLLNQYWGVQSVLSSPYHPQTNGCVENANGSLKDAIRSWQRSNPDADWKRHIEKITHQLNCNMHHTTGIAPYRYTFGIRSWKERRLVNEVIISNNINVADVDSESESENDEVVSRCSTPGVHVISTTYLFKPN